MKRIVALFGLVLTLLICGCGGSSGSSSAPTSGGTLSFKVKWPVPTRLIPVDSLSIVATLTDANNKVLGTQTLARATGATSASVSFTNLTPGAVTLTATAYPSSTGTGVAQATGSAPATIVGGQTTPVTVTMADTIVKVVITPASPTLNVSATQQLTMTAYDATNEVVLTSPTTTKWSSQSTQFATVSTSGLLTGGAVGSSLITVTETESGKSGTTTATVQNTQTLKLVNPLVTAVDQAGKYVYALDNSGHIFCFGIGSGGQLSSLNPSYITMGQFPASIAYAEQVRMVVGAGNYLYVVVQPVATVTNNYSVLQYQINTNGSLTPLSPASVSLPGNDSFSTMVTDASQKHVYIQFYGNGSPLFEFSVTGNGTLSQIGSTITNASYQIYNAAPVPNSNYIMAMENLLLTTLQVQSDGTLKTVYQTTQGYQETNMGVDGLGHFAYALSHSTGLMEAFSINSDGSLTDNGLALPTAGILGAANFAGSPDGKYLVMREPTSGSGGTMNSFSINQTTGALTPITTFSPPNETNSNVPITITPNGQFVYEGDDTDLSQFSLSSGVLTPLVPPTVN